MDFNWKVITNRSNKMRKLTSYEELISSTINDAIKEAQPDNLVQFLIEEGFIHIKRVERFTILKEVAELHKNGMPRCLAMEEVSYKYCCSYEKVRGLIYNSK